MLRSKSLLLVLCCVITACSNKYYYKEGLDHAEHPTGASVSKDLSPVETANTKLKWQTINGEAYVLAVTWKADTSYYTKKENYDPGLGLYRYNTGNYPIFVTMAPYLQERNYGRMGNKKLTMRLNQLLGLPPTSSYSYFLEVWVKPEDFFRPCFDPSIVATSCTFKPTDQDVARKDHMSWLYKYMVDSYSDPDVMKRYPFSHLGYTYDWNKKNKCHVGLSEFVIGRNKNVYIRKVYTTKGYFQ